MIARRCETTVDAGMVRSSPPPYLADNLIRKPAQLDVGDYFFEYRLRSAAAAWPRFRFRRRRRMLDDPTLRSPAGPRQEEVVDAECAGRTAESVSSNCRNFNAGRIRGPPGNHDTQTAEMRQKS